MAERFVGSGNAPSQQSAMKLVELGPRVTLELFKVEKGMCEGDILYHKFEEKSAEESAATKARVRTSVMMPYSEFHTYQRYLCLLSLVYVYLCVY